MHQLPFQVDALDIKKPGPWPWVVGLTALVTLAFCVSTNLSAIQSTVESSAIATVAAAKASDVSVTVDGRDVTLTGTLSTELDRDQLVNSIRGIEAVRIVNDDMQSFDPRQLAETAQKQFQQAIANVDASGITFEAGNSSVSLSSESTLLRVAQLLKASPDRQIKIAGHTDNSGNAETNLVLSRQRAQSVADFLLARGIGREQLVVQGYGPTKPRFDNSTESGRAKNRRIEFIFMK